MMTVHERYQHDGIFKALVDQLYLFLDATGEKTFTATELREAVLFASEMYEARRVRPLYLFAAPRTWGFGGDAPLTLSGITHKPRHIFGLERPTGKYKKGVFGDVAETYKVCSRCGLSDVYSHTLTNGELCLPSL